MSKIVMAPTGKLIHGDVLDVNRKSFERKLKEHDPQLYTEWNPQKRYGWGCWEIRRLPGQKSKILVANHKGQKFYRLEYWETNTVNHVLDVGILHYGVLDYLKSIDTWEEKGSFAENLERKKAEYDQKAQQKIRDDLKYKLRYNKSVTRDFMEAVKDGYNPLEFFAGIYKD